MFESKSGIAELSFNQINNLALKAKKSFCLMPSYKMLKNKNSEKFYVINGYGKIKIYLENSILTSIFGNINFL